MGSKLNNQESICNIFKAAYAASHYYIPYTFMKGRSFHPKQLTLEITFRCNLNCIMCPQSIDRQKENSGIIETIKSHTELSTCEIKGLLNDAASFGVKYLTVTGGEPLLRKDIVDILAYAKSKNLYCTLLSNGTRVKEDIAREIVHSGVDKVTFSLDGPQDIHETIRNSKGSFAKLKKAILLIQKEKEKMHSKNPQLSLTCTISSMNADQLSKTVDIASTLGISINYGYLF